jgi:hypothetical protein
MDAWAELHGRSCFVRYEDIVGDPVTTIARIYEHAGVSSQPGGHVIMKNKRVIDASGHHASVHATTAEHLWVAPDELRTRLRPEANVHQIGQLTSAQRATVTRVCGPLIRRFGYETL